MELYALDRKTPLKLFDDFSVLNNLTPLDGELVCHCAEQEYFVLQLLLVSGEEQEEIAFSASPLTCGGMEFPHAVTCFNTQGVDKWGIPFEKTLTVTSKEIQPLYIGFQLEGCGAEKATAALTIQGAQTRNILVTLLPDEGACENNGVNDLWRLSRLKWLNSTLYQDEEAVAPYRPVTFEQDALNLLGRRVSIGPDAMPQQCLSFFDESILLKEDPQAKLLDAPICFDPGEAVEYSGVSYTQLQGNALLSSHGESGHLKLDIEGKVCCEGSIAYQIRMEAKADCTLPNVALTALLSRQASGYNNGLGKWGGAYEDISFRWNDMHQDALFTSGVNCGLRIKWKAEHYLRPLVNIYYAAQKRVIPVETWDNHGNGSITSTRMNGSCRVCAQTGAFSMKAGEVRVFLFELHFTPFQPVDYRKHYATRYCHNNALQSWQKELEKAKKYHLSHIVVHHGNLLHPFINYPFIEVEEMKRFVAAAHKEGIGVKFYYTSREHSNHMAEVFPYKALGGEIILRKQGQGYSWQEGVSPWLTKYFGKNIIPAWRVIYKKGKYKGDNDISFLVRPDSRLDNYYVEGLNWLVKEIGIDGIYIDDTALDRETIERARKVLSQNGGLIDMHMWNHEEERAGNVSCMNLYTEIFPFLDSLWIGEGFPVHRLSADYILMELSGFPYGQTSAMLDGSDQHAGMLYAMNSRYGWGKWDAPYLYALWDAFGIQDSEMRGYWHSRTPVKTDDPDVLATSYLKDGKALVAIYNFSKDSKKVNLRIDTDRLGFIPKPAAASPRVKKLQSSRRIRLDKPLCLRGRKGILLLLEV